MIKSRNSSRRKTLSHLEIESFLCELGSEDFIGSINATSSSSDLKEEPVKSKSLVPDENLPPNFISCSPQRHIIDETSNVKLLSTAKGNINDEFITNIVSPSSPDIIDDVAEDEDENAIRLFCKVYITLYYVSIFSHFLCNLTYFYRFFSKDHLRKLMTMLKQLN